VTQLVQLKEDVLKTVTGTQNAQNTLLETLAMARPGQMEHTFGMNAAILASLFKMVLPQLKSQKMMVRSLLVKATPTYTLTALRWSMEDHVKTVTGETEPLTGTSAASLV
jgi:hypothetical protein